MSESPYLLIRNKDNLYYEVNYLPVKTPYKNDPFVYQQIVFHVYRHRATGL